LSMMHKPPPPYTYICLRVAAPLQVFITHLHSDHHADLASLYVGAMFGRKQPWEVWGPSGDRPQLGTAAAIEGLRQVSTYAVVAGQHVYVCDEGLAGQCCCCALREGGQ
jgi:ribonuclease BN (tRNA processing enzyme)